MKDSDLDWLLNSSESEINKGSIKLDQNEVGLSQLATSNVVSSKNKQSAYYEIKAKYSLFSGLKNQVDLIPGAIVVTDLLFKFEHTGVYVGNGNIVELHGDGSINLISIDDFINGGYKSNDTSFRTGINIYTATYDGKCIASEEVASRALNIKDRLTGKKIPYHMLKNNCHMFSGYCFYGKNFQKNTDCALFSGLTKKIINCTLIPEVDEKVSFWNFSSIWDLLPTWDPPFEDYKYSSKELNRFCWTQVKNY